MRNRQAAAGERIELARKTTTGQLGPTRLRPLQTADLDRVMAIAAGLPSAPHWNREMYAKAVDLGAVPARIGLVAEDCDGSLLGFAVTVLIAPQAELETIAVAYEAQRRGIGRLLCTGSIAKVKELGVTEVILEVRESNHPARALYDSLGFVETGRRSSYYSDPQEDALLLQRAV